VAADEKPWTVTASEYVRKDRWIGLRADDCLTPEGVRIAPYYVIEYPDWVQIVAIDAQDNLLLVRQYRHGSRSFTVELPAGRMDPGETDPVVVARRELLEETGFEAAEARLVNTGTLNPAGIDNAVHTVVCTGLREVAAQKDDPTERIDVLRLPLAEAVRRAQAGEIIPMPQTASLLLALMTLGRLSLDG
jgi:8-oxo-dGTP pyrophosphatase MutT (NUDIX family)